MLCRFSSHQFRQKIHRSFGFLALLVSPVIYTCWLRLDFHSFVLFALVLRAHCRVGSRSAISSRCLPRLPPPSPLHPQKTGRRFSIKCPAIKTAGRRGRRRRRRRPRVQRMKLYSNDVRTLFPLPSPTHFSDRRRGI